MEKIDNIINLVIEDLRLELCLVEYEKAKTVSGFLKAKFRRIEEMLDRQLEVHKNWDSQSHSKEKSQ